jgi:hypothetical protein
MFCVTETESGFVFLLCETVFTLVDGILSSRFPVVRFLQGVLCFRPSYLDGLCPCERSSVFSYLQ